MNECITRPQDTPELAMVRSCAAIGERALATVDSQYGSGMPLWIPGINNMPYHNGFHGRQVGADSALLAHHNNLGPAYVALSKATGYAHDVLFTNTRGVDEAASAEWLGRQMDHEGNFDPIHRSAGKLAILGTEPLFDTGMNIIGQRVSELVFPSHEAEVFARGVASADFGMLYRPAGVYVSHLYMQELFTSAQDPTAFPLDKVGGFLEGQVNLLEGYAFPLASAEPILATHRSEVTAYAHQVLGQFRKGDITDWATLYDQDMAFMRQYC